MQEKKNEKASIIFYCLCSGQKPIKLLILQLLPENCLKNNFVSQKWNCALHAEFSSFNQISKYTANVDE